MNENRDDIQDRELTFFYAPDLTPQSQTILLSREESHHARRVLRKHRDDPIGLTNGTGLLARARIQAIRPSGIQCLVESIVPHSPPQRSIHVGLALIRPNRMDWAIEKLTELGVHSIHPLVTEFTTTPTFKRNHLERIAISALKQSKRAFLPILNDPLPFREWINRTRLDNERIGYIAHWMPDAASPAPVDLQVGSVYLAVGPEGGFSETEIRLARRNGFQTLKLQEHTLRSETAAVVAVTLIKFLFL